MSLGQAVGNYHAGDLDRELIAHGMSPEKFWNLDKFSRNYYMRWWLDCFTQQVGNRHFNYEVHRKIAEKDKESFFKWLLWTEIYERIKND